MHLALYQPDIPQNLGSILRLCACMETVCHIIEPCGFILDDKRIKRAAMDYIDHVRYVRHASWEAFLAQRSGRVVLFTTKAQTAYTDFVFRADDIVLFGRESAGVPQEVAAKADAKLRIPIAATTRSLNIAQAAAIALAEARRQLQFR